MLEFIYLFTFILISFYAYIFCVKSTNFSRSDFFILFYVFGFRFLLSSFHGFTFPPLFGGLSLISIHTITSVLFISGFVFLNRFVYYKFSLVLVFVFISLISALMNNSWIYSTPELIKILYFFLLIVYLFNSSLRYNLSQISYALILFALPVSITQIFSFLLGQGKATEGDGSVSYIGLYFHEAVFSSVMLFLMFLSVYLFSIKFKPRFSIFVLVLSIISIALSNYRTTFLSALPLMFFFLILISVKFDKFSKLIIGALLLVLVASAMPILVFSDRFYDLYLAFENLHYVFVSPDLFDRPMMQIMSGRLYFWSQYIYEFSTGSFYQKLFGNGLGAWQDWASLYAHNQFVSYLYELGFLGLLIVILMYLYPIYNVLSVKPFSHIQSKLIIFFVISFSLLSMSTMPLWSIEGIFIFSYIYIVSLNIRISQ